MATSNKQSHISLASSPVLFVFAAAYFYCWLGEMFGGFFSPTLSTPISLQSLYTDFYQCKAKQK